MYFENRIKIHTFHQVYFIYSNQNKKLNTEKENMCYGKNV